MRQVRGLAPRGVRLESVMNVRRWLGDIGLAVLLALPTATLANPSTLWKSRPTASAPQVKIAAAEHTTFTSRMGLPG